MIVTVIKLLLKIIGLIWLITFEKVIGVPWLYLLTALTLLGRHKLQNQWILSIFLVVLLATVYNLSLLWAVFLIFGSYFLWTEVTPKRITRSWWLFACGALAGLVLAAKIGVVAEIWTYISLGLYAVLFALGEGFFSRKLMRRKI